METAGSLADEVVSRMSVKLPIVHGTSGSESALRPHLRRLSEKLWTWRYSLSALFIPVLIRTLPELIVGPYPVGYDTIASYVPNTMDWTSGKLAPIGLLETAPLMYIISISLYYFARIDPLWIFKIMGPALYGLMIWSLFRFSRLSLGWTSRQALAGSLLTSVFFVSLRISWDLYRYMLGLAFLLFALSMLPAPRTLKGKAVLSALVALAVAANQLTGVTILLLLGARALTVLSKRRPSEFFQLFAISMPGLGLQLAIFYAGLLAPRGNLIQVQPLVTSLDTIVSTLGFLILAFLPIIPLALLGRKSVKSLELKTWSVLCVVGALTALSPLVGVGSNGYRLILHLDVPLCIYAAAGIRQLSGTTSLSLRLGPSVRRHLTPAFTVLILALAISYATLPAEIALPYYTAFPTFIPTSMIQNTVPLSDMGNLKDALHWTNTHMSPDVVLITHQAIYGWVREYLPSLNRVINYGISSPLVGLEMARSAGFGRVFMIWWIDGQGWHGQQYVPAAFELEFTAGNIAVYTSRL